MNINNIEIFNISLENPEKIGDIYYHKSKTPIITKQKNLFNKLIESNNKIIDLITTYQNLNDNDINVKNRIIENIIVLLQTIGINNSEFVSCWALYDMSYSIYEKLEHNEKIFFLQETAIPDYIQNRHNIYKSHGYTATTLQARKDSSSHKGSGNLAIKKVSEILNKLGVQKYQGSKENLIMEDNYFLLADGDGKTFFDYIKDAIGIDFKRSSNEKVKYPDFLIKVSRKIFIVEHKHKNEGGGGQNGQISEVINLIELSDKGVSYMGFIVSQYGGNGCAIR